MDIRSCVRYLNIGERLSITKLWSEGHSQMDLAYNAVTARPLTFTFHLDQPEMVFFFIGGRSSLAAYFSERANLRVFIPREGQEIGLIFDRKSYMLKKDKTLVGVCNASLRCGYDVTPITNYNGQRGVAPLDTNGSNITTAQLATVVRNAFFCPVREAENMKNVLQATGIGW
ncbi:MAG: hypothetical protein K1X57_09090 [Gemmataceae bacterium]|nr:hypothetical protein [Gemmataceae bacterium]